MGRKKIRESLRLLKKIKGRLASGNYEIVGYYRQEIDLGKPLEVTAGPGDVIAPECKWSLTGCLALDRTGRRVHCGESGSLDEGDVWWVEKETDRAITRTAKLLAAMEEEERSPSDGEGQGAMGMGDGSVGERGIDADDEGGNDAKNGQGQSGEDSMATATGVPSGKPGSEQSDGGADNAQATTAPDRNGTKPQEGEATGGVGNPAATGAVSSDTSDCNDQCTARDDIVADNRGNIADINGRGDAVSPPTSPERDDPLDGEIGGTTAPPVDTATQGDDLGDLEVGGAEDGHGWGNPDEATDKKDGAHNSSLRGSPSTTPRSDYGGWFIEDGEPVPRKCSPSHIAAIVRALGRIFRTLEKGVIGEPSPRIAPKALVKELVAKRVSLAKTRKEEMEPGVRMVAVDVSGSMSRHCVALGEAAIAVAKKDPQLVVVYHSNGYDARIVAGPLPKAQCRKGRMLGEIVEAYRIRSAILLGDGDAFDEYRRILDQAKTIWLDPWACRCGGPKMAGNNWWRGYPELMGHENLIGAWQGVGDNEQIAYALRRISYMEAR